MKVRTGFVSNSSSSSFVIMTTKKNHDEVLSKLTEFHKKVVEAIGIKEFKFCDIDCVAVGIYSSHGCSTFDDIDIDIDDVDDAGIGKGEAWEEYRGKVREKRGEVFVHSQEL
jgi:hypothetical protein